MRESFPLIVRASLTRLKAAYANVFFGAALDETFITI